MGAQLVLDRLAGVKARGPGRWVAKCPAHKDRTPSLSVRELPDGRVLIFDFGGCSVEAVLDAMGLEVTQLFPQALMPHGAAIPRGAHAHAAGDLLHAMAREALAVKTIADFMHDGATLSDYAHERLSLASSDCAR